MTALTVRGVTKAYGATEVLRGIDLHVPNGSLTAVLGPSGCGKTTLLRLVAGFDDPDFGTIAFGADLVFGEGRTAPAQRRRVGYVAQEGALFPHLDVAANITFGLPRRARRARSGVGDLLELVGLPPTLAGRYAHQLSGGQQQRVALARALAPDPSMVLLDEPFSSLDANQREDTRRAVAAALRAAGTTALLVTHDQAEALSIADQVAVLREGRVAQIDSPAVLYRRPADAGVARFVGDAVLLPATFAGQAAHCALGALALTAAAPAGVDGEQQVMVRPEQLMLHRDGTVEGARPAQVLDAAYFGHDASVRLRLLPDGPTVTARIHGDDLPVPGALVGVSVLGPVTAVRR